MRTSLLTNPKVNGIARELENSREVSQVLSTGYSGSMNEIVTRNVMRHVTVSSLLVIWGAANEHTRDGEFANADLSDIDDMVGIPGFGAAMESVGWLVYDADRNSITLPNFSEYNTSGSERSAGAKSAAQRQKEYRERKKALEEGISSDVTGDVTSDVTRNRREEKRREEKKEDSSTAAAKKKTAPRTQLPEGFQPNAAGTKAATDAGLNVSNELRRFCDHHDSKGSLMANWQAAWRTWVNNAISYGRGKAPASSDMSWLESTGFDSIEEAANFGCRPSTAHLFRNGQRIPEAA